MEIPKDYLNKFEKSDTTWNQELGREMTEYFGRSCYWIPHKFEEWKIRQKFKEIQELDVDKRKNFKYFLGMLNG